MFKLSFRVYGVINEFLPNNMKYRETELLVTKNLSIFNLLRIQGIPKDIINLIVANNNLVNFNYKISDGDQISFYPKFKNIDRNYFIQKINEKKRVVKFLVPIELKELSEFLLGLGFDVKINSSANNDKQFNLLSDDRVSLKIKTEIASNDYSKKNFLKEKIFYLTSLKLSEQIKEILHFFIPEKNSKLLSYCHKCNTKLLEIERRIKFYEKFDRSFNDENCQICSKSEDINLIN